MLGLKAEPNIGMKGAERIMWHRLESTLAPKAGQLHKLLCHAAKASPEPGFITKASAHYCDMFPLRALIKSIPGLGGTLDAMLAGLGAKYQYDRLKHFIEELNERLKPIEGLAAVKPGEPLWDFVMQVFDQVIRSRSEEKRNRFANLVANQVIRNTDWDEAETAARLLAVVTDLHIQVLDLALKIKPCDHPDAWSGGRVLTVADPKQLCRREEQGQGPTKLGEYLPWLSSAATEMICFELMARGLLRDVGVGGFGGGTFMGYFEATESATWLMDWIREPKANSEDSTSNRKTTEGHK